MAAILYIYIIDSSSLIDLKKYYPIDIFQGIWNNLENLIINRRLFSSIEVLKEISRGDDELKDWCNQHKTIFKPINSKITMQTQEILDRFPELGDIDRTTPIADPFLIALALERDPQQTLIEKRKVIVTEEKSKRNKINIPYVSNQYGIESSNIIELFRKEKWTF